MTREESDHRDSRVSSGALCSWRGHSGAGQLHLVPLHQRLIPRETCEDMQRRDGQWTRPSPLKLHLLRDPSRVLFVKNSATLRCGWKSTEIQEHNHQDMNLPQEICVFFFSMSALGVLYVMNNIAAFQDALEQDGFTRGFTEFYQRTGEPYMVTAYAIMMCYWDGIVHFLLYLLLLRRMSRTAPYRSAGLFWAGSCFASMAVFIPGTVIGEAPSRRSALTGTPALRGLGALTAEIRSSLSPAGKYGSSTHPASWLNGRFLLGAAWAGLSLLRRPRELPPVAVDVVRAAAPARPPTRRPHSALTPPRPSRPSHPSPSPRFPFARVPQRLVLCSAPPVQVVLDCPLDSCFTYIYGYEPYLKDPVGYPRLTMLLFLFYGLPLMAAFVYGLWTPGCAWMLDWTVLFAGAVAQAQWCHIGASLHMRTPYTYRTPEETWWPVVLVNLLYTATPLLLAYRCVRRPAFFVKSVPQGEATQAKKND
ncbi:transmembrane 6 superfamily member 2-like [Scleropages formosus]|uniref:Transmembrane 6 superfamily member 2-like n=1 Tax=Scleropages formosus TaxID=113540 RepID=A0A0P7TTF7_SCLFO|nr:transmembrane 6 superfamily member 2-like [Scleropages formosus]